MHGFKLFIQERTRYGGRTWSNCLLDHLRPICCTKYLFESLVTKYASSRGSRRKTRTIFLSRLRSLLLLDLSRLDLLSRGFQFLNLFRDGALCLHFRDVRAHSSNSVRCVKEIRNKAGPGQRLIRLVLVVTSKFK